MRVLILAYASEPDAGSEYGVGWNVPFVMARTKPEMDVFVLTRSRCKEKINRVLDKENLPNLHYLFYDVPCWLYYKDEMGSRWGEQFNYLLWQILCRKLIRKQHQQLHFDVIHHLTFNQYRTPSSGFFLNLPFVMGPVGGAEIISPVFFQDLEAHSMKKEKARQIGKDLKIFEWWMNRKNNRKYLLFSSHENLKRLEGCCGHHQKEVLPAIAYNPDDFLNIQNKGEGGSVFSMVYAGKALDWKGIHIFLKAVKYALEDRRISDYNIKLVGIRFEDEQKKVMAWVKELYLENHVELIPFMERTKLLQELCTCSLSVYPAFRDSGSMSVLEASALGCPTVCFNVGGQDAFPDEVLLKVDVANTYDETMQRLAHQIYWAYSHRKEAKEIGMKAKKYVAEELTWQKKVDKFVEIYHRICSN